MNYPTHLASGPAAIPLLQRDLEGARTAYARGDPGASAVAHAAKGGGGTHGDSEEPHQQGGEYVKLVVFGGLDGILTSFAIVAGAAGVGLGVKAVLGIGISNVLADALAMGVGEYLSTKSENEYIAEERSREAWEFKNHPEGEISEMVEIFVNRGMSKPDAEEVISRMAKYPEFFINLMMTEELGLKVPDESERTLLRAFVMFASFATFGFLPILGYTATAFFVRDKTEAESSRHMMIAACAITSVTLVGLGAFKAHFAHRRYLRSALETLLLGGVCATLSYNVGLAVASINW
ncbi:VIT family-domain-containing protein [Pavlovales sp. CCMP2436]|nr:VIT family-domain-containing protein [Pavlovales sp. CCMP2436]